MRLPILVAFLIAALAVVTALAAALALAVSDQWLLLVRGTPSDAGVGILSAFAALVAAAAGAGAIGLGHGRQQRALADWTARDLDRPGSGWALIGMDGRLLAANALGRETFAAGENPLAPTMARLAMEPAADEAFERLRRAAASGLPDRVEIVVRAPDAGPFMAADAIEIAVDPAPPAGRLWRVRDVTAQRAIDAVLARERREQAEFLDDLPAGLFSIDVDRRFVFCSRRLAEWLRIDDIGAVIGRPIDDFIQRGAVPEVEANWQGWLEFSAEDGESFRAFVVQTVYDSAGRTLTRSVVLRLPDEADGQAAGAGRVAVPARQSLIDRAPFGIARLDDGGRIMECNAAFAGLAGIGMDESFGVPMADLITSDGRMVFEERLSKLAMGTLPAAMLEAELVSGKAVAITAVDLSPETQGMAAFLIDATARRTLEAQFAQAQKMQAMGRLAGGIAHDFNNLLTAMIGFCDLLLQRHGPGDPSFADIMQVKQNANRAADLVRQLLAFSRRQPVKAERLDTVTAISDLSHLLQRLLGETVNLSVTHERAVGDMRIDKGQFDQVIVNLAVNARDAMPDGGTLAIRTARAVLDAAQTIGETRIPTGDYVRIEVADTGTGIAAADLPRIFEPFFSRKAESGTGLGLATVYGIVSQSGGHIAVQSTEGVGTVFSIFLPRMTDTELEEAEPDPVERAPVPDLTGSATILFVEDEDAVRAFAARALKAKGYRVVEADSGEAALALLPDIDSLDLLITDMVMPGMDGLSLAKEVLAARPAVTVVVISGYSEEIATGGLDDMPDLHFLPKPFNLAQLAAKVKDICG